MRNLKAAISKQTLGRLPLYMNYLKTLTADTISATAIAEGLGLGEVQVRKDLASVSSGGRPKVGYLKQQLTADIRQVLDVGGCGAVIVGMGKLGSALAGYKGFKEYGLEITAAFDVDPALCGQADGMRVFPVAKLPGICRRMQAKLGIITVPAPRAQQVCGLLVEGGVAGIWNFAPVHLEVPEGVLVRNEDMAASLAILSKHIMPDT